MTEVEVSGQGVVVAGLLVAGTLVLTVVGQGV